MSTGKLQISQIVGYHNTFYERCYKNCSPDFEGYVSSKETADLFRKSGLDDILLSKIWNLSDSSRRGKLNYYEFCVALKLVALAQSGLEAKLDNLQLQCQAPRLLSHNQSGLESPSTVHWSVSREEQAKFSSIFDSLNPGINQKLSGDSVKPVLMKYGLPVAVLGRIWSVADIDSDGYLDREEFILAMHLGQRAVTGQEPPLTLPRAMMPPSKRVGMSGTGSSRNSPASSLMGAVGSGTLTSNSLQTSWVVGKLEKEQYDALFYAADLQGKGFVTGGEVKDIFVQSGLSQSELALIWNLCDINQNGQLNSEQFALAMYLVNQQIKSAGSRPIPSCLTPEMIPPSFKNVVPSQNRSGSLGALPNSGPNSTLDLHRASPLSLHSFGIKPESDEVYKEIEILQRERNQVEQTCRQLETDLRNQRTEVSNLQETLEKTQQTCRALSAQKEEAQQRLDALVEAKQHAETELAEVREKCAREREELTKLREKLGQEAASEEKRRSELKTAQAELERLLDQEKRLGAQAAEVRKRLEKLELESGKAESDLVMVEKRNKKLEGIRVKLEEVLASYEAALKDLENEETVLPDEKEVEQLLSTDVQFAENFADKIQHNFDDDGFPLPSHPVDQHDPFSNSTTIDPFSTNDPFSCHDTDPFNTISVQGDPSQSQDPFSQDPFSPSQPPPPSVPPAASLNHNGWHTTTNAFSIGNVDDLFKNMPAESHTVNARHTTTNNDFDAWGDFSLLESGSSTNKNNTTSNNAASSAFDDAFPFDSLTNSTNKSSPNSNQPPPRPVKAPSKGKLSSNTVTSNKKSRSGDATHDNAFSESDQLNWAKHESAREARAAEEARKREQADLELAIKLSKQEMKSTSSKK